ncbi:MAG: hypothetical protein AAF628_28865 [Planctomycetota bacterium]
MSLPRCRPLLPFVALVLGVAVAWPGGHGPVPRAGSASPAARPAWQRSTLGTEVAVSGRVVDEQGRPARGFALRFEDPTGRRRGETVDCDEDGNFRDKVQPGWWSLEVTDEATWSGQPRLLAPPGVFVPPDGVKELDVVIDPRVIRGHAVDARGRVIEWGSIEAEGRRYATIDEGAFVLYAWDGAPERPRLRLLGAVKHGATDYGAPIEWGAKNVRIEATGMPVRLTLSAVDPSGDPVPVRSCWLRRPPDCGLVPSDAAGEADASGGVTLEVMPGDYSVGLNLAKESEFSVPEQMISVEAATDFVLRAVPRPDVDVLVTDLVGRPIEGATVSLVRWRERAVLATVEHPARVAPPRRGWRSPERLSQAKTDADGRATLRCTARELGLLVTVAVRNVRVAMQQLAPNGAGVRFAIPAPARLRGHVRDRAWSWNQVLLRRPGASCLDVEARSISAWSPGLKAKVQPSGIFDFGAVPAGTWELVAFADDTMLEPPLAVIELAAGEQRHERVDGAGLVTGALAGVARVDGAAPAPSEQVVLVGRLRGGVRLTRRIAWDAEGRFEAGDLSPGDYAVGVARPAGAVAWSAATATVRAGERATARFEIWRRPGRLVLRQPNGEPLTGRVFLHWHDDGADWRMWLDLDEAGHASLSSVPTGALSMWAIAWFGAAQREAWLPGPYRFDADAAQPQLEVVVPPAAWQDR